MRLSTFPLSLLFLIYFLTVPVFSVLSSGIRKPYLSGAAAKSHAAQAYAAESSCEIVSCQGSRVDCNADDCFEAGGRCKRRRQEAPCSPHVLDPEVGSQEIPWNWDDVEEGVDACRRCKCRRVGAKAKKAKDQAAKRKASAAAEGEKESGEARGLKSSRRMS